MKHNNHGLIIAVIIAAIISGGSQLVLARTFNSGIKTNRTVGTENHDVICRVAAHLQVQDPSCP